MVEYLIHTRLTKIDKSIKGQWFYNKILQGIHEQQLKQFIIIRKQKLFQNFYTLAYKIVKISDNCNHIFTQSDYWRVSSLLKRHFVSETVVVFGLQKGDIIILFLCK